jgi:centromere/kinetochore protein ZW10
LYVPSWFKASYLSEILTGSLVDIEFLYFEAGALVDYSKPELISLIRSLFADTPKRARVIDRIQAS